MVQRAIRKEDLGKLIAAVNESGKFFAPVDSGDGATLTDVSPEDEIAFAYTNFTLPPKRAFFPRSEVIAAHGPDGMTEAPLPDEKVVLFGVRPCDALALVYLDKVFVDEQFTDPYYRGRRQNAVIISLACNEPEPTCFCTSVNGHPAGRQGADVLAVDLGDVLLLESITDKGEAFMSDHASLLSEPTP